MELTVISHKRETEALFQTFRSGSNDGTGAPAAVMEGVTRVDMLLHHLGDGNESESDKAAGCVVIALVLEGGALASTEGSGGVGG